MKFWQWLPVQYWWLPVAWLHPGPRSWWISECPGKSCKVNLPEPQQHCCIYVVSCRIKLPTPFISFVNFSSKHESWVSKPGSKFICNSTWPHSPVFPGNRGLTSSWILLLPSFGASVLFFGWVSRSIEKQHFFSTAMSTKSAVSYLLRVQRTRTKQPQARSGSAYIVLASSPDRTRVRIWSCWVCFQKCTQKVLTKFVICVRKVLKQFQSSEKLCNAHSCSVQSFYQHKVTEATFQPTMTSTFMLPSKEISWTVNMRIE